MIHFKKTLVCALVMSGAASHANQAQPVPVPEEESTSPQIQFDGVGIATGSYQRNKDQANGGTGINFSDSAFMLGASQKLYNNLGVGSFGLGGLTNEASNRGLETSLFLHRAFVDFQSESFEFLIGRSDNPTAHLVDFPTLRGDDLITLTNPLNPFSNGENAEEHRYSNVASASWNQDFTTFQNIHAQQLIQSATPGSRAGLNSVGGTFEYKAPVGSEAFVHFPSWGVGVEHIFKSGISPTALHQIYAGGVLNLNESITNRWDLRAQDIVSIGSNLRAFTGITDTYQANSNTATLSLRYLHSPFGAPGYQLSLTGGYKNYFNVTSANSLGGALTAVKRLGQNFDLIAQYQGQWRQGALAAAQTSSVSYEQAAELGFIFSFQSTINPHIAPRRSMLNQQHQYIP